MASFNPESTMSITIPSALLGFMSEADRTRLLESAMARSNEVLSDYVTVLDARLRAFEQRYEIPSSELSAALASGRLHDTADVSQWVFWVNVRGDLDRQTRAHQAE